MKYRKNTQIDCISAYNEPEERKWEKCPYCNFKPKVWIFDNGQSTVCGCGNSEYDHFSIHAESILSFCKRANGNITDYDNDELRKN